MRAFIVLLFLVGCVTEPVLHETSEQASGAADRTPAATHTMHVGAAAFVADSGFGVLSQYGYLRTSGAAIAYASLEMPAGTTVEAVAVYYLVGDGAVRPAIRRMDPATGALTAVWLGESDNTGTTIEMQTAQLAESMVASDVYWIEATMTGPSNRLYGAVVDYIPAP